MNLANHLMMGDRADANALQVHDQAQLVQGALEWCMASDREGCRGPLGDWQRFAS